MSSPFSNSCQPICRAKVTSWPIRLRAMGFGAPLSNRIFMREHRSFDKALTCKFEDCLHLIRSDVEHFRNLPNRHSRLEILKDSLHRHARPTKHPRTAHLPRNAFDRWALRPIETRHTPPLSFKSTPKPHRLSCHEMTRQLTPHGSASPSARFRTDKPHSVPS